MFIPRNFFIHKYYLPHALRQQTFKLLIKKIGIDNLSLLNSIDKIVHSSIIDEQLLWVNAHNYIEYYSLETLQFLSRKFCEEECILYSADYCQNHQLIAGGTVFRSILIWGGKDILYGDQEQPLPVQYKLEGHEGVIFDVKFLESSKWYTINNKELIPLASVSDDRTLRIWKIDLKFTGKYQQIMEFYGHRSRIWLLRELGHEGLMVTACEDSTCKIWQAPIEILDDKSTAVTKSLETLKGHSGKNIRGLACHKGFIATGGDDGAIKVWNANEIINQKSSSQNQSQQAFVSNVQIPCYSYGFENTVMIDELANLNEKKIIKQVEEEKVEEQQQVQNIVGSNESLSIKQKPQKKKKKGGKKGDDLGNLIRAIEIFESSSGFPICLLGTSQGSIITLSLQNSDQQNIQFLAQDKNKRKIQDIQINENSINLKGIQQKIIACSIGEFGEIVVLLVNEKTLEDGKIGFETEKIAQFKASDIKILNVWILNIEQISHSDNDPHAYFSIFSANGRAELLKHSFKLQYKDNTYSCICENTITMKVAIKTQIICLTYIPHLSYLVCGDTKGNLFVFDNKEVNADVIMNCQQLKAHKNERINSLQYNHELGTLYSTSKDNFINLYNFDQSSQLQKISSIKEEDLNIIYNLHLSKNQENLNKMIMLGFYGNYAYVWNKEENMQVFSIDCKGGNRPIRLKCQERVKDFGKKFLLAYSHGDLLTVCNNWGYEQEQNQIENTNNDSQFTLRDSLHGREILAVCGFSFKDTQKLMILSGSEDSFLKISEFNNYTGDLKVKTTFSNHIASIRALAKTRMSNNNLSDKREYLVLSAGSRMQANIFKATISDKEESFDMGHICSFMRSNDFDVEQDFRIMSASIFYLGNDEAFCSFGCSSGQCFIMRINMNKRRLEDQREPLMMKSSILSMKKVRINELEVLVVCGLSNGDICIVKVTKEDTSIHIKLITELPQIHDFGVNSLDAKYFNNSLIIVSGGDDQQISVLLLKQELETLQIDKSLKQYAHSSCIKGVTLQIIRETSRLRVTSSSYDQRYKEWDLEIKEKEGIVLKEGKVSKHCMSDMNGIGKVKVGRKQHATILVGQGLAIY